MTNELGIWEIAVLSLLREAPMHPYQMQALLRHRHKDEMLALKRGSLYHAIGRLQRDALIAVKTTSRQGNRPERTTYRITPQGRARLLAALHAIVATPRRESSEFMAAMSFLIHLRPQQAARQLELRSLALAAQMRDHAAVLAGAARHVDRINLVESEYLLAMLKAELHFTRRLAAQIQQGALTWDLKTILRAAAPSRTAAGQRSHPA